ncbi:MAG: FAD-dependent protein [bacterium]
MNKMQAFDVLIVGGGPAGLFAAKELILKAPSAKIALIEKGVNPEGRVCPPASKVCNECDICDVIHGIGGSGLQVDAKLCIDTKAGIKGNIATEGLCQYLDHQLIQLCNKSNVVLGLTIPENPGFLLEKINDAGLDLTNYPVRSLGTDRARVVAETVYRELKQAGVKFFLRHEAIDLEYNGNFSLKCLYDSSSIIESQAPYVVLAPGRSGSLWISYLASKLGFETVQNPIDVGVRIETTEKVLTPLNRLGDNPKIKLPWHETYLKTHCYCPGGFVIAYKLLTPGISIKVVDGHKYYSKRSKNSNINLLVRLYPERIIDPINYGMSFLRQVNLVGQGRPILQRFSDFVIGRPSSEKAIKNNEVEPSLPEFSLADINMCFPAFVTKGLFEFVTRLNLVCPGIASDNTLFYGPALEWCIRRVRTQDNLETTIPNLFVAGDGAGLSQGVIAAAMTGIVAARSIAEKI